jgi:ligand-binding sensor domain-containing protein
VFFIAFDLAEGPDGALWVGTNYGLYRRREGAWSRPYQPPWDQGSPEAVHAAAVDAAGVVWMGTRREGLALYDGGTVGAPWIGPLTAHDGLASDCVEAIVLAPAGVGAWVGTTAGLSACRWAGDGERSLACRVVREPGLTGVPVHSLTLSPAGEELLVGAGNEALVFPVAELW